MPYLNVDLDYFDHPQTLRLVGLLGRGAEVLPIRLWAYCGKFHSETGELTGLTEQEIESVLKWWGKPGKAVEALLATEYLEKRGQALAAAHWSVHNGHIWAIKERSRKANNARWDAMRKQKELILKDILKDSQKDSLTYPLRSPPSVPSRKDIGAGAHGPANGNATTTVKRCARCFTTALEAGQAKVCKKCSWCSHCERVNGEPKLDPNDPQHMLYLCRDCATKPTATKATTGTAYPQASAAPSSSPDTQEPEPDSEQEF